MLNDPYYSNIHKWVNTCILDWLEHWMWTLLILLELEWNHWSMYQTLKNDNSKINRGSTIKINHFFITLIISQSINGTFMMSQSFLALSDNIHIKSQVFTLKWWKDIKYNQLWHNTHDRQPMHNVCEWWQYHFNHCVSSLWVSEQLCSWHLVDIISNLAPILSDI